MSSGIYTHKPHSKETREKISIALTGRKMKPMSDETREQRRDNLLKHPIKYWLGKHLPEEMKRKIGEGNKGKCPSDEKRRKISISLKGKYKGEKSSNWQGGISSKPYSVQFNRELKELIRERDCYKCQLCGMPECENIRKLSIHHIDYNKKNSLPSNLISLCNRCNAKVNYNRKYWTEYFGNKLKGKR